MKIPLAEQEIVATILMTDNEWQVNVSEARLLAKLLKVYTPTRVHKDAAGIYAAEFMLPRRAIRIIASRFKDKVFLTDEQKAVLKAQLPSG